MIEKVLYDYLNSCSLSASAYMEQPAEKPASYYLIEKTGGSMTNHIYKSVFAIQSYGATLLEAAQLNDDVKKAMFEAAVLNEISRVELNGDYNFTDPETKQYRYQAVFVITHY